MPTDPKAPNNKFAGPTFRYGPNGAAEIFHHSDDVPEGWTDNPADHAEKAEKPPAPPKAADNDAALPMTKKQVVEALADGGIEFKPRASHAALYELLVENLRKALTEAEIAFAADADATALLELLPKPE